MPVAGNLDDALRAPFRDSKRDIPSPTPYTDVIGVVEGTQQFIALEWSQQQQGFVAKPGEVAGVRLRVVAIRSGPWCGVVDPQGKVSHADAEPAAAPAGTGGGR